MFDFISVGEILIDFAPYGQKEERAFQQNPGGAPANVACVLAKLGLKTAFVGKIGDDPFGASCKNALKAVGVCTDYMPVSQQYPTTLAFVCLDENGNREFSFYRDHTADVNLDLADVDKIKDVEAKVFHFGSVSLTAEPARTATLKAVEQAKANGSLISYDPNLRLPLWSSPEAAKKAILDTIGMADILKISEEEAEFLFGSADCEQAAALIFEQHHIPLIIITRGPKGCYALVNGKGYQSYAYDLKTVDTTGAGDSFLAGVLYQWLKLNKPISQLQEQEIEVMFDFANAIGSLVTTKKGAIPAIPSIEQIEACMQFEPKLMIR